MKQFLLTFIFLSYCVNAQSNNWSLGTAHSLNEGQWESGFFQPLRYGLSDDKDIAIHPFFAIMIPNFMIKQSWKEINGWKIASRHSANYPTPLLRSITGSGKFKIVSDAFDFPHLIGLNNEILVTKPFGSGLFTAKAGLLLGLGGKNLNPLSTIDIPLVYPRLAVYYNGWGLRFGADYSRSLVGRWSGFIDGDLFLYPGGSYALFYESKIMFIWTKSSRLRFMFGYKITYGEYPFGDHWQIVPPKLPTFPAGLPLIDIQISW